LGNSVNWVTLAGNTVSHTGYAFDFAHHDSGSYTVDGAVYSDGRGISGSNPVNVRVDIGVSGTVWGGDAAIHLSGTSGMEVYNHGTVISQNSTGIYISSANADILNNGVINAKLSGSIFTGANGIYAKLSNSSSLTNSGTIYADYKGIAITQSDNSSAISTGSIFSQSHGMYLHSSNNATFLNTGEIYAAKDGFHIYYESDTGVLNDFGDIVAQRHGVAIDRATNFAITNTGSITGESNGIQLFLANGATVTNSGYISDGDGASNYAIRASLSSVVIENSGVIDGDIQLGTPDDVFIYNGGSVNGVINTGEGNDRLEVIDIAAGQIINLDAGYGSDTVDMSGFGWAVWADLEYNGVEIWTRDANAVTSGTWRAIVDVENLTGTMGIDVLRGNDRANSFFFVGEQGIGGMDTYDGRDGSDTVDFSQFQSAVWIDLSYTGSHVWTRDGNDLSSGEWRGIASTFNMENIIGSNHNDELRGDDNANRITGGSR